MYPPGGLHFKNKGGLSGLECIAQAMQQARNGGCGYGGCSPPDQAIKLNVVFKYFHIIVALASGCVLGYALARYRAASFQNRGDALVRLAIQARFEAPDFHLLNHITLQLGDGTTQIDHILVSRYGVFVIETKDYSGWIFANAKDPTWTQTIYGSKFKFQNPIFQNARHLRAVQELLNFLSPTVIQSVVVFAGSAKFKTEVPTGTYSVAGLVQFLQKQKDPVLSLNRVQFCVGRLETARLNISGETDLEHLQNLERRHGQLKSSSSARPRFTK